MWIYLQSIFTVGFILRQLLAIYGCLCSNCFPLLHNQPGYCLRPPTSAISPLYLIKQCCQSVLSIIVHLHAHVSARSSKSKHSLYLVMGEALSMI